MSRPGTLQEPVLPAPSGGKQSAPRLGSAVIVRLEDGRILLGRRDKEPNRGKWILPGGGVQLFESIEEAARREIREETGLEIEVEGRAGVFELINPPNEHRVIVYSWARPIGGVAASASDLFDMRFFSPEEATQLDLSPLVREVLASIGWL
jgi:8-oxo-dGTP diphosphatase